MVWHFEKHAYVPQVRWQGWQLLGLHTELKFPAPVKKNILVFTGDYVFHLNMK